MSKRFNIVLIRPAGFPHAQTLLEPGLLLHFSLISLGYSSQVRINSLDKDAVNVMLGYHLYEDDPALLDSYNIVMYQLEQLNGHNPWWNQNWLKTLAHAKAVWDFDAKNVEVLRAAGIRDVQHLPLGYHESLEIVPRMEPEIDVLFYGSQNARRKKMLKEVGQRCRLRSLFGVYGYERDQMIARARIILNLHSYEMGVMEQPRMAFLLSNGRFVLSEESPDNPYEGMIAAAAYEDLPGACLEYLRDDDRRQEMARRGREKFMQRLMVENLRNILGNGAMP